MEKKFNKQIEKHKIVLKKYNTLSSIIGYIKLFLFILLVICLYHIFFKGFPLNFIIFSVVIIIPLIILWIYHNKIHNKIDYSNGIIAINKRHLDRISGKWIDFKDIGEEFINYDHAYALDLDIVGKKSLFQFLNITHTWHGRQSFAKDLLSSNYSMDEILKRQEALSELSKDVEFLSHIEYYLSKIGTDNAIQGIINELKEKKIYIKNKIIKMIIKFIPFVTITFIIALCIFRLESLYLISISLVFMQLLIWLIGIPKNNIYLYRVYSLPYKLSDYSVVFDILKNKDFTSPKLKQIQNKLGTSNLSAALAIKELAKLSDKRSEAHNGIMYFVLNVFFLWDYKCSFIYEKWKLKYSDTAKEWFNVLGEFESLLCFANLPNICNNTCVPIITSSKRLETKEIGHPLLLNDIRVNNDFLFKDNIFIISGSNMSGKTTFLRTVGINLVLACAGSFVCAKHMIFTPVSIITSMRIADDLNEGVSTFYAELKRIKTIIERAKTKPDILFLIDEIFRGTNSVDRLKGATTVISKLNELKVRGIITTHDLELCELANKDKRFDNYSFSEYYMENTIRFDYIIQKGKSKTTNAEYLMKMIGII